MKGADHIAVSSRFSRYRLAITGDRGASYPMQRVAVDIVGPFPQTAKGNLYVLVAADYFTISRGGWKPVQFPIKCLLPRNGIH